MKVILYTAPACPFCLMVEKFLERNNIKFDVVDISKDKNKKQEMEKKSNQSNVPVVDVDGKIIVGYDLRKLKQELNLK
ncbi:MAG: glutaredoxin domain-containing protein [Candidatus Nanoarchaeia archaeon]|nr:glutaredoxin domain-containing protein [Candidatus Nanoarchaeia archaeon]